MMRSYDVFTSILAVMKMTSDFTSIRPGMDWARKFVNSPGRHFIEYVKLGEYLSDWGIANEWRGDEFIIVG
ncbi:MAG: hypothetical protein JKY95_13595 [Planctomycetaceae bacterium]|nr:hypothetical protein [Planctomycetaceae bacterium]